VAVKIGDIFPVIKQCAIPRQLLPYDPINYRPWFWIEAGLKALEQQTTEETGRAIVVKTTAKAKAPGPPKAKAKAPHPPKAKAKAPHPPKAKVEAPGPPEAEAKVPEPQDNPPKQENIVPDSLDLPHDENHETVTRHQLPGEAASSVRIALPSEKLFVPTPLQGKILEALTKTIMQTKDLAKACKCDGPRLFKPGGVKELMDVGLVAHRNGVGYYRPDKPPPNAVLLPEQ
jgi:hypothetical protein